MSQFLQYWDRRGDFGEHERHALLSIETQGLVQSKSTRGMFEAIMNSLMIYT